MIGTMSRKKLAETFDRTDKRLTVISFDRLTGYRNLTYARLNMVTAMREVVEKSNRGMLVKVYIDLPDNLGIDRYLDVYETDKYKAHECDPAQF